MTKLLLILLVLTGIILLFFSLIIKAIRRIFQPFSYSSHKDEDFIENKEKKIIYNKDNVIVLKGDAKDKVN